MEQEWIALYIAYNQKKHETKQTPPPSSSKVFSIQSLEHYRIYVVISRKLFLRDSTKLKVRYLEKTKISWNLKTHENAISKSSIKKTNK